MNTPLETVLSEQDGRSQGDPSFRLAPAVADRLAAGVPVLAEQVVSAVMSEVPSYADPFRAGMGTKIATAVRTALDGFLELASGKGGGSAGSRHQQVHGAAYSLGQGEARAGRSIDALTTAYGVGARVAWRHMGEGATRAGLPAADVARFAGLVFAYINELSVSSITGHAEELASRGLIHQRRLERLCQKLLEGAPESDLRAAATLAEWEAPTALIAVLLPAATPGSILSALDVQALRAGEDATGVPPEWTVLLVPERAPRGPAELLADLEGIGAFLGPARPWMRAGESYARALQAHRLGLGGVRTPLNSDDHLVELVLGADPGALADLRARVLAPLKDVSAASRVKLTATLAAWLLHQGRREEIAAALFVHPQTVRYRMGQLRDLYGERLTDPRSLLELTVALATLDTGAAS